MSETIRYSRIGKEDIRFGKGSFEVRLADGRVTVLNEVDLSGGVWHNVVYEYGASGDGVSDNRDAFQRAIDKVADMGGGTIVVPSGKANYKIGSAFNSDSIGPNTTFLGMGNARLSKEFNGNLFYTSQGFIKFINLRVNANGNTYTGPVLYLATNSEQIEWTGGEIIFGADSVFLFEDSAGTRSSFHDFNVGLASSHLATGAAVKRTIATVDSLANPMDFHHITTEPFTWFANVNGFMGANFDRVYSAGITLGDNCLGCVLSNCRLAVPTGMTAHISGNSTMMSMCEIGGDLTIDAGFLYGQFVHNVMDPAATFTDNSTKFAPGSSPRVENPTLAIGVDSLVVATANLPAASTSMNGRMLIEDGGAGDRNLIIYAGGQRFRIDGGTAF